MNPYAASHPSDFSQFSDAIENAKLSGLCLNNSGSTKLRYFVLKIVMNYCEKKMFELLRKAFEIRG